MGGKLVRTIGIARARTKIGMMNLVYNMRALSGWPETGSLRAHEKNRPSGGSPELRWPKTRWKMVMNCC